MVADEQRKRNRNVIIAKLEDFFTLDTLCGKCTQLKRLKKLHINGELEDDLWEKVILLLVGMGYVAQAKEFADLRENTAEQRRFIDDVALNRDIDTTVFCDELKCNAKQIRVCFGEYRDNCIYSPAYGVLVLNKDEKEKLGFIYKPPKKNDEEQAEKDDEDEYESNPDETGLVFKGIDYNIFTKYILINYNIMLHTMGEYYLYENNCWKPFVDARLKRILRRFFLKYESHWTPAVERIYMSTLGYDCLELSELKIKESEKYINLRNGMLNIETFEMEPHDKRIFSTIQIPIDYESGKEFDPKKDCPRFMRFLRTIFNKDKEIIMYIQEVMGYCLSNSVEAHKMWFFLGGGSNGKSVLCDILTDLVGGIDNISTVSLSRFNSPFALAHIKDKTMNIATENEVKGPLNTQAIKAIASGDPIQMEEKFKTPLSYCPRTKLIFSLNNMPEIKDLSEGFGRRLDIVPFKVRFVREPKFPNERQLIPNIKKKLQKERDGIFAFAIEGLKRLQQNKYEFSSCRAVEEQREKIGKTKNLCSGFASMCLEVDDMDDWTYKTRKSGKRLLVSSVGTRSTSDDLFASFIGWCLKNQYEKEAKVTTIAGFLRDFRATLRDKYDFKPVEEGKAICENEEDSNNVLYFNCVKLKDSSKEFIEPGMKFIVLHNLRKKQPEAEKQLEAKKQERPMTLDDLEV